ncbi:hypothetical protein DFH11DRAFT_1188464 [Phellopilus nigrolimitatus]|nr:hypothetical protein DFH11DRAFT_1188464 [Phellopilus nigrolimitatus]
MSSSSFDFTNIVLGPRNIGKVSEINTSTRELTRYMQETSSLHSVYNIHRSPFKKPSTRDVFIRDLSGNVVAGLIQSGWYRNSDLYRWLRIVLVTDEPFLLRHASSDRNQALVNDDTSLIEPSEYFVINKTGNAITTRPISEKLRKRINYTGYSTPKNEVDEDFQQRIMKRDGHCCFTHTRLPPEIVGRDPTKSVIDIFPSAYVEEFLDSALPSSLGLSGSRKKGVNFLRSLQNGMTMGLEAILSFEDYDLAIDVDDNYRIVQLSPDSHMNLGPERKLISVMR